VSHRHRKSAPVTDHALTCYWRRTKKHVVDFAEKYREGAAFGLKRLLKKVGMAQSTLLPGKIIHEVAPGKRRRNRGRLVAP
jgi:hypothetical protein